MKNLNNFITEEKSRLFKNVSNDEFKCIYGALLFIDSSDKRDEFCKVLDIEPNIIYELENELEKYVQGKSMEVDRKISKLAQ